ncbi:hypothetical protein Ana3638_01750 [Anaerocolumna sedimenticola]|uniref:Membrane protein NfeD2 N-terminal transmembrane domain-containing protein n=1 Tax=Anaerocolumna sedimenticola TaxID=2696063 RepID=A0A6P1TJ60_9FIRM|nr:hypothetical protein [Anaerocolumna sedimenticola]QHQ59675.1 hypothetical protein Ana3638_01750 [Anaerocolumna sedimenticola]
MLLAFQVCFFTSIGLIIISFLLGSIFDIIGLDGFDLDFHLFGNTLLIPASPILLEAFFLVFGGIGWILLDINLNFPKFVILLLSCIAGIFVSLSVHKLVLAPLKKAQNTSAPNIEDLVGLKATVTESIYSDGFGEIRYVINGNSFTSPAKSTNGGQIKAGKDVAICWIEDYVFYVASLDDIGTQI